MAISMTKTLKNLFAIEKKPLKGLVLMEWAMVVYALFTLVLMLFFYTRLQNPVSMIIVRFQSILMVIALWAVYRMLPCKMTLLIRIMCQLALLAIWYPDTFEFNRIMPNLDHYFATCEQQLFGCQPALLFHQKFPSAFLSELLTMGYVSYYPMMFVMVFYFYSYHFDQLLKASFVMVSSFFLFYVIFIFLPVAGPQYYYLAVGLDQIALGHFPDIGNYFETHTEVLPAPGWTEGMFYKLLTIAHDAGERPTAAFPSSHVGVMVVFLWQALLIKAKKLFWTLMLFTVLTFFATFYLQAHYVIDAIAGIFAGTFIFFLLTGIYALIEKR